MIEIIIRSMQVFMVVFVMGAIILVISGAYASADDEKKTSELTKEIAKEFLIFALLLWVATWYLA